MIERPRPVRLDTDDLSSVRMTRCAEGRVLSGAYIEVLVHGRWVRATVEREVAGTLWVSLTPLPQPRRKRNIL